MSALPKLQMVLAGLLTGALYLTDPIFIWIVPVMLASAILLSGPVHRIKAGLFFLLPLMVVTLPWMTRNAMLTGNPIFGLRSMEVWMDTKDFYPGALAYRMMPDDLTPSVGLFKAVVSKIVLGSGQVIQAFPQVSASWVLAFLLPSLLFRFSNPAINSLRRVMMYSFLGILIGTLLFGVEMPLFVALIPTMLVFAAAYLVHLIGQAQLTRPAIVMLAGLLTLAMALPLLRDITLIGKPEPSRHVAAAVSLEDIVSPNGVVLSDQPWLVAWYANRPSVWIPAVDGKIKEFRKQYPTMRWMFLTDSSRHLNQGWQQVYDAMQQWNARYSQMPAFSKPSYQGVSIRNNGHPLTAGLDGFTTVEPAEGSSLHSVIAVNISQAATKKSGK